MSVTMSQALGAYNAAVKSFNETAGGTPPKAEQGAGAAQGADFAGMVKNAVRHAIGVERSAEQLSMAAVAGKADLNDVITAVAEAEVTVQAVVAIRDKAVEAYKDIVRMQI